MVKDRGIDKVDAYFGNFTKLIDGRIKKQGKVKILDAGCGYGVAMMGFIKRFGDKVELTGYNYSRGNGNPKIMKKQAIEKGIFTRQELKKIKNIPKFVYCDASKKLPFKDNSFDFIYSMASLYLYDDKIGFLEECSRILKKNGLARISPAFVGVKKPGLPKHYITYWEIWDKGKEVKIWDYCKRVRGVKAVWKNRLKGDKPMYIEIKGNKKVDFKLNLVGFIDYRYLYQKWGGVKSIYSTQLETRASYKVRK